MDANLYNNARAKLSVTHTKELCTSAKNRHQTQYQHLLRMLLLPLLLLQQLMRLQCPTKM